MLPISVCIIAKNEEQNIEKCLKLLRGYEWEIVVVDTGSEDRTREIALRYADKVADYAWTQDFAAARNFSVSLASHDWILGIDCDEYLEEIDVDAMTSLAEKHPVSVGLLPIRNHYQMNGTDSVYEGLVERFFDRRYYRYSGAIHEQIVLREPEKYAHSTFLVPLILDHSGYNGSEEALKEKAQRNISLLEKELKTHPDNPYTYFQIGQAYNMIHDDEKACQYYSKGLSYDVDPSAEYVQMMVIGYGYALLHLGRQEEALGLSGVYEEFAVSADFLTLMGLIYLRNGQYVKAMMEFVKALSCEKAHVVGANSFIPSYNLGLINEMMGEREMALRYYRKCGDFPMALEKLAELEQG